LLVIGRVVGHDLEFTTVVNDPFAADVLNDGGIPAGIFNGQVDG
jgi:hypothetical protein